MLGGHLINFEGILGAMAEWQTQWTQNPPSKIIESSNLSSPTKTSACRKTAEFLYVPR